MRHPWSVARRLAVMQAFLLGVVALFSAWAAYVQSREVAVEVEQSHTHAVAALLAQELEVREGILSRDPAGGLLQERAMEWVEDTGVSWITVMAPDGTRLTNVHPEQIGTRYPRSIARTLAGETVEEVSTSGMAGRSVRTHAPVYAPGDEDGRGEPIGVVAVGRTLSDVEILVRSRVPVILATFGVATAIALAAVWATGRYLRRVTLGRGPEELAESFLVADTAMNTLEEGIVLTDPRGTPRLVNDAARRLLGREGEEKTTAALPEPVAALARPGACDGDHTVDVDGRVLVVRRRSAVGRRTGSGVVLTLHDRTDLARLTEDLTVARSLTAALRAQTHEHGNQLHTALSLLESGRGEEARTLLRRRVAARPEHGEAAALHATDPFTLEAVRALLEAKAAEARERGVEWTHRLNAAGVWPVDALDLITLVGNLVDNALDAASGGRADPAWVDVEVECGADGLHLVVADSGPGLAAPLTELARSGVSTKPAGPGGRGVGLALVRSIAEAAGGRLEAAQDSGTVVSVEIPAPRTEET